MHLCLLLLFCFTGSIVETSRPFLQFEKGARFRRSPSAFHLAYLQKDFDDEETLREEVGTRQFADPENFRRDEVVSDAKCLERCNSQLNSGMDMVNAHMAFGSIDVPSVVAPQDLDLFCQLDRQHSQCIDECGYSVQFNLREYVCKQRMNEMKRHLSCYARAAPLLTRHCRPRCGSYAALEHTLDGYATRCRQLLCDHVCTDFLLQRICGTQRGQQASNFLLDFSKLQVEFWIRDYAKAHKASLSSVYPMSCSRIKCSEQGEIGRCPSRS